MKTHTLKLIFLLMLLTAFASQSMAQHRKTVMHLPKFDLDPYHFGFILAANQMLLTWKPVDDYQNMVFSKLDAPDITIAGAESYQVYEITTRPVPGFAVGIVGNLRLGNHFDLRFIPTLAFGERYIDYSIIAFNNLDEAIDTVPIRKSLPSTMVDFPFHIKYRSKRFNNFAAYVLAGGKYSLEMASTKKILSANGDYPVKTDRHDLAAEVGVGADFYTPYFKFGVEAKMSFGGLNALIKDDFLYSNVLDRINNKVFQLSFTFE